jgi:hypothetical protein
MSHEFLAIYKNALATCRILSIPPNMTGTTRKDASSLHQCRRKKQCEEHSFVIERAHALDEQSLHVGTTRLTCTRRHQAHMKEHLIRKIGRGQRQGWTALCLNVLRGLWGRYKSEVNSFLRPTRTQTSRDFQIILRTALTWRLQNTCDGCAGKPDTGELYDELHCSKFNLLEYHDSG